MWNGPEEPGSDLRGNEPGDSLLGANLKGKAPGGGGGGICSSSSSFGGGGSRSGSSCSGAEADVGIGTVSVSADRSLRAEVVSEGVGAGYPDAGDPLAAEGEKGEPTAAGSCPGSSPGAAGGVFPLWPAEEGQGRVDRWADADPGVPAADLCGCPGSEAADSPVSGGSEPDAEVDDPSHTLCLKRGVRVVGRLPGSSWQPALTVKGRLPELQRQLRATLVLSILCEDPSEDWSDWFTVGVEVLGSSDLGGGRLSTVVNAVVMLLSDAGLEGPEVEVVPCVGGCSCGGRRR